MKLSPQKYVSRVLAHILAASIPYFLLFSLGGPYDPNLGILSLNLSVTEVTYKTALDISVPSVVLSLSLLSFFGPKRWTVLAISPLPIVPARAAD